MIKRRISVCGSVLSMALLAAAVCNAADQAKEIAAIKQSLANRYPDVPMTEVRPSPVAGVYEVLSTDSVAYVDRTGDYLIAGPMIATRTKADLSQQVLDDRDAINFSELPLDEAIKTVRGDGDRRLAVFADPDCPYCRNLEKELSGLGNVTIYTFLYPITALHPDARNKSRAIWCAPERSQAWHDWMILDKAVAAPTSDCSDAVIDEVLKLGTALKISGTPVVFLENGHRISGARTAAQLDGAIETAHRDKPRAASNGTVHPKT
jgi:thiol:disulfide interchange protein DsbC